MFDLISIGDAVIDTFIPLEDADVKGDSLCLRYGDKIPVGPSISLVAGNAANNAVGASRLRMKVAQYVNIGGDSDGQKIKEHLKEENIDTRYVVMNKDLPSNHHVVLDFRGERTILIYHQPWNYVLPELEKAKWVYLTSLSPSYVESDIIEHVIRYLERTGAKLCYQPGTFQLKQGIKKSSKLLSRCDLFVVNLEEAKVFLGYEEQQKIPPKKLLRELLDLGMKQVIITDGIGGSYGSDGSSYYQMGIFSAKLIEMTGCGDSYATATMAGLFYGKDLSEAMRWGAANGASVVEQIGPQAGLLTYDQMQHTLKQFPTKITKILQ